MIYGTKFVPGQNILNKPHRTYILRSLLLPMQTMISLLSGDGRAEYCDYLDVESPESKKRVQWGVRLPPDLVKQIEELAEYEGKPIQEVTERVWRMFFEANGPLPKKKSFLETWPIPKLKSKKP